MIEGRGRDSLSRVPSLVDFRQRGRPEEKDVAKAPRFPLPELPEKAAPIPVGPSLVDESDQLLPAPNELLFAFFFGGDPGRLATRASQVDVVPVAAALNLSLRADLRPLSNSNERSGNRLPAGSRTVGPSGAVEGRRAESLEAESLEKVPTKEAGASIPLAADKQLFIGAVGQEKLRSRVVSWVQLQAVGYALRLVPQARAPVNLQLAS